MRTNLEIFFRCFCVIYAYKKTLNPKNKVRICLHWDILIGLLSQYWASLTSDNNLSETEGGCQASVIPETVETLFWMASMKSYYRQNHLIILIY